MCQVHQCCCCLPLRVGCMVTAAFTIFLGVIGVAFAAWLLTDGLASAKDIARSEIRAMHPSMSEDEVERDVQKTVKLTRLIYRLSLSLYAVWLFSGILIFAAVATKKRTFLLPWMIVTSILIGVMILEGLGTAYQTIRSGVVEEQNLYTLLITGLTLTGNLCGMCGVRSYYSNNCREVNEVTGPQVPGVDQVTVVT